VRLGTLGDAYVSSSNGFDGVQDYCHHHQQNISFRLTCPPHCRAAPGSQTPSWRLPKTSVGKHARLRSLCEYQSILGRSHWAKGCGIEVEDVTGLGKYLEAWPKTKPREGWSN
jgi:hypothetical protein